MADHIFSSAPAVIIIGEDRHVMTSRHFIAVGIAAHSAGQHNPRTVIISKSNRSFDRPCRQNRLFRINAIHDLPWGIAGFAFMLAHPFQRAINAVVKRTENRGACHHAHIVHAVQLSCRFLGPSRCALAVNLILFGIQPSAHDKIFISDDHAQACTASGQSCH